MLMQIMQIGFFQYIFIDFQSFEFNLLFIFKIL